MQYWPTSCSKCEGSGEVTFSYPIEYVIRCNSCKMRIMRSKICSLHPGAGYYTVEKRKPDRKKRCQTCVGEGVIKLRESSEITSNGERIKNGVEGFDMSLQFDRKLLKAVNQLQIHQQIHPFSFIKTLANHIEKYKPREAIHAFREMFVPHQVVDEIATRTGSDKCSEKTRLSNVLMWTLTFFLGNKTESLAITEIANASASLLGRGLSDDGRAVDHNTLGVRLEKPALIEALELMLHVCSAQLGAFEDRSSFVNIYYDWFYLAKSGNSWKACQEASDKRRAIKIGIGIEWETKAVVSLVMHSQFRKGDTSSFRESLMVTNRPGIIHITDRGPFDSKNLKQIRMQRQHFIIRIKKNLKLQKVHPIFHGMHKFVLDIPSKTPIRIQEVKMVELVSNPQLGDVKYIRFQYNDLRSGKFKTIKLISSLPFSAEQIIQIHALRWVATETEFRTLQHQFGLEKIYIRKAEKAWSLLLLVLCGKMMMEFAYRAIHSLHRSGKTISFAKMQTASFRRGFANFMEAILTGKSNPFELIEPCEARYCCYRNNRGQRLK